MVMEGNFTGATEPDDPGSKVPLVMATTTKGSAGTACYR